MEDRRLGRPADRDATEMPVFDADGPLPESRPPGRAVVGRRRGGSGRGVGLAVAVLVLLTAGVAGGGLLDQPSPTDRVAPLKEPPATSPFPCVPVAADSTPSLSLGEAGLDRTLSGRRGRIDRPGDPITPDWEIPGEWRPAAMASGLDLELRTARGACIGHVTVEYAEAGLGHPPRQYDLNTLIDTAVEPASPSPAIGTLPDGDWLIRAVVHVDSGVTSGGSVLAEFYFRVQVGPGPFASPTPVPDPTPAVTPAVACGPTPADPAAIEVLLATTDEDGPVPGAHEGAEPPVVGLSLGDGAPLSVAGDACATSWAIRLTSADSGESQGTDARANPAEDPAYIAQNRWWVPVPAGDYVLEAELTFGPGVTIVRTWRLVGLGFTVPEALLIGDDGSRVFVLPGCGLSVSLANGYSASDSCGNIGFPGGLEVLHVPAWSPVVIDIPGWTVTSWYGSCGRVVDSEGSAFFEPMNGCWLGAYSVGTDASPPAPAQFLARPGEQVIQLGITATRDGDTFSVAMYAIVSGE